MMLLIASFQPGQGLRAANFYWDSDADATGNVVDGTNLGGTGSWDLGTANWWDTVGMVIWPNSTADTAVFAGTAGIVTLATPLSVGSLQFDSSGYQLTGSTLTLGGAATISVSAGNHAGVLSDIAGTSGLTKTGAGTLNLGPLNSYTGNTTIQGGVVEVYEDESLGAGGGDIILDGGTLSALGNNFYSTRNITVNAGGGTLAVSRENSNFGSMRLAGMISGVGTLTKTGFGQLRLDGDSSGFTGAFILDQGTVRLNPYTDRGLVSNVPALGASSFEIHAGGDLLLYYNSLGTTPYYSAVSETAPVHMTGGRIQYISNNSGAVSPWTQTMGDLFLDGGANRFLVQRTSSSSATLLAFGDLSHAAGATADFRGTDGSGVTLATLGSPGNQPRLTFNSLPAPVNDGILGGWATVNLNDFADYDPVLGVRLATYTSTDITTAGATDNVDITGAGGVIATIGDTTVNSIRWTATASTSTIQQDPGSTLTIDTGGLLVLGNFNKRIQASSGDATIKANGGALYIYNNQGTLTIDSIIADGDQPTALVKSQAASLTLNGANTYTGGTYLNGGNNLNTGSTAGVTYLGTGPVFITGGILVQNRPGATTSTQGYTVSGGGAIFVNTSTLPFTTDGDRYTIDGNSVIAGPSTTGSGLNSLTYVAGAVSAGGEVHLEPGATVMHTTNNAAMGIGTNTIQGLPNNMDFYFGEGTTQTAGSGVTVGVGTPWKGLGTDRNTRGWDQGTISVNGSDFELHGLLAPSVHGESQSAYALRLGNNTAGLPVAGAPTITGAAATPLNAHVTGGIVQLMDDAAVYGDTTAGSALTFLVEPGATLEVTADGAMGSGNGIASAQVLDGGTFQQFYSTSTATNIAISAASASGINGNVTVQPRGRFLAQHNAGLTGTGIITFEPVRSSSSTTTPAGPARRRKPRSASIWP
jgi:fibronectin-binding autotransporter adhesin